MNVLNLRAGNHPTVVTLDEVTSRGEPRFAQMWQHCLSLACEMRVGGGAGLSLAEVKELYAQHGQKTLEELYGDDSFGSIRHDPANISHEAFHLMVWHSIFQGDPAFRRHQFPWFQALTSDYLATPNYREMSSEYSEYYAMQQRTAANTRNVVGQTLATCRETCDSLKSQLNEALAEGELTRSLLTEALAKAEMTQSQLTEALARADELGDVLKAAQAETSEQRRQ
ncbi:hypothetical protein B0T21DRAFT_371130 [Apiosordaria backusii]|uniref:Uncharacterized protein n=1 Tax=Apiosordaria backusii TaxID=314023 RepID=A0AA40E6T7_9PEZI|nr:hypothetical protein B0T21DRAFT_371130 [Apiosordaria backusii]